MYTFNKENCTEKFDGTIHSLAILAAITNLRGFGFAPEEGTAIDFAQVGLCEFFLMDYLGQGIRCKKVAASVAEDADGFRFVMFADKPVYRSI